MADDSDNTEGGLEQPEEAGAPAEGEEADASGTPTHHGRVEALSEEEIRSRLVSTDSGATLDHAEVVQGMAHELGAQRQVIDLLSEQREPEGVNIAKVLDSSTVDLEFIMGTAVTQATASIIGGKADPAQRRAIRDQISLPFTTAFKMCLRSVWIRIGRVAITGSGIFLGIAFYASVSLTAAIMKASASGDQPPAVQSVALAGGVLESFVLHSPRPPEGQPPTPDVEVLVTPATTYRIGNQAATARAVKVGVGAEIRSGPSAAGGRLTATEVVILVNDDRARQMWLICMALMVSVVGISNSMLMAVAERFREIGTMKCLGALDSFIVKLFVIESGLLGLLAGLFGAVLGMAITYVIKAVKLVFSFRDVSGDMLWILVYSVLLGTILSVLAAILPANQAAKMPAAAALRTDV